MAKRWTAKSPMSGYLVAIAATLTVQTEDKALSREAGFDHHLVKPVDPDALLDFIQKRKAA